MFLVYFERYFFLLCVIIYKRKLYRIILFDDEGKGKIIVFIVGLLGVFLIIFLFFLRMLSKRGKVRYILIFYNIIMVENRG